MRVIRWTRWALWLSCAAGLGLAFQAYSTSPARVPVHYEAGGIPDRWGSPLEVLIVYVGVIGLGTALFLATPEIIRRAPASMVNLPHKEYWLAPENRDAAAAKLASWANVLGTAINLLMISLQALLSHHPTAPSRVPDFLTVGFVVFALGSCIWLARSYQLPTRHE